MNAIWAVITLLCIAQVVQFFLLWGFVRHSRRSNQDLDVIMPQVGTKLQLPAEPYDQQDDGPLPTFIRHVDQPGRRIVAYLSPSCAPCKSIAGQLGGRRQPDSSILIVAVDDLKHTYEQQLEGYAVLSVSGESPILNAVGGVTAFPTIVSLTGGTIVASAFQLEALMTDAPVV